MWEQEVKGIKFIFDDEDFAYIKSIEHLLQVNNGYLVQRAGDKKYYIHRIIKICDYPTIGQFVKNVSVGFKNGFTNDLRRENLFITEMSCRLQQQQVRTKNQYPNIYKSDGRYIVEFRGRDDETKKTVNLYKKRFDNLAEAIMARNKVAKELYGRFAVLV